MRAVFIVVVVCSSCMRPYLTSQSKYNVNSLVNDSTWFATGKAIRLIKSNQLAESVRLFNLQIATDIDYVGNRSATRSETVNGCVDDCVPTQRLHIYNIPLTKGKFKLSRLDKDRIIDTERTNYWLLLDGGGVNKNYQYSGRRKGWVKVLQYNDLSNIVEGNFSFSLDENINTPNRLINNLPRIAKFEKGYFKIKLTDVRLKE